MRFASSVLVLSSLAALSVACSSSTSGNGGGGGGSFSPSVDASRTVDSLSSAEAEQLCKDSGNYESAQIGAQGVKKIGCDVQGAFAGVTAQTDDEAKAACKKAVDDCMAAPDDGTTSQSSCTDAAAQTQQCKGSGLTVAELDACTEETVAAVKAFVATDVCATVKAGGGGSASTFDPQSGPKCAAAKAKCPALFGSGAPTADGGI